MDNNFKLVNSENSKVFFWGCTHVFHKQPFIWQERGYNSIEEHAAAIRDKINKTCGPNDTLIHLGDGFLNSSPQQVEEFWKEVKCNCFYLFGNHEGAMTQLYRKYRDYQYGHLISFNSNDQVYPLRYRNLTFLGRYAEIEINKKTFVCQHFPLRVWNNSKRGTIHVHSHNHGKLISSLPEATEGLILDCGVDVFSDGPVSYDKVMEIMSKKKIASFDGLH